MIREKLAITYLLNSGFLIETADAIFVFDMFCDPAGAVERAVAEGGRKKIYFFASHFHADHFDAGIFRYAGRTEKYILSYDIRWQRKRVVAPFAEKTTFLSAYDAFSDDFIAVESYDSTDEGVSFGVTLKDSGEKIFHAGDFNWWHWAGDTEENIGFARNGFFKQLKKLEGKSYDIAFFPVDGRLETAQEWGGREFLKVVEATAFVAMHRVGYPVWQPSADFLAAAGREGEKVSRFFWSPSAPGEKRTLEGSGELNG